ncbi:hypothetical protein ABT174_34980 [Streptomyces sparsogenes]|uniref:hypothetical protein n=1 Tax=Streptomyces sparsogenes TaxID=67365 RepID=UPI00331D8546
MPEIVHFARFEVFVLRVLSKSAAIVAAVIVVGVAALSVDGVSSSSQSTTVQAIEAQWMW